VRKTIFAALTVAACITVAHAANYDWPNYGRDSGGSRFSILKQITAANVGKLQPVWIYHMRPSDVPASGRGGSIASEETPLEINGVVYLATPYRRLVALDAATGKENWVYQMPDSPATRGVAYWQGTGKVNPRIIIGTNQGRLIAVDAKTGRPASGFGENGIVELKTPDILNGVKDTPYGLSAPPSIYRNIIIVGSRVQEAPTKGAAGDVRGFDAITGKLLWTFRSIPPAGSYGNDTWQNDSWRQRSGVNVWNMITVDDKRGIAYLAFGAPTFDRYGGDRIGDNLFSDSLVAVNASTGRYLWHYQVTHHDIWDYDLDAPPTLVDVKRGGKVIPAVVAVNKTAILFVLNRVTGEPLFPVTETPVPKSDVEGEVASPTQPIPIKPIQLVRNGFSMDEIATVTPELNAACRALINNGHWKGSAAYQPISSDVPMIRFPGGEGGSEWGGGAFDPTLGLFVIATNNLGYVEKLVKQPDGSWANTNTRFLDPATNMMCQEPPWGTLNAVNVSTGEIAWRVPLGVSDQAPAGKQNTGRPSNGGPILTASGLTFIGGTDDARFRAFDTKTGKELWSYKLDHSAHATPFTYMAKDGRQYVGIVATGGTPLNSPAGGDSLIVFALPR